MDIKLVIIPIIIKNYYHYHFIVPNKFYDINLKERIKITVEN